MSRHTQEHVMSEEQMNFAYEQAVRAAVDVATRITAPNAFSADGGDRSPVDVAVEVVKAAQKAAEMLTSPCARRAGDRA